jgi:ribosome-binding protein aMBF1 (putative translation factor)
MPGQVTNIKKRVAANIAAAMDDQDVGPSEVARRIGGHERAVRRWRDGEVTPGQDSLARLAIALEIEDAAWFYVNEPAEATQTEAAA